MIRSLEQWRKKVGGLSSSILLLANACTGAPKELPPRTPPSRAQPLELPGDPIPEKHGRLVLNGTDGPLKVSARGNTVFIPAGRQSAPSQTGELCVTPCIVDLPAGKYRLFMTSADGSYDRGDTDNIEVREGVNFYVRAPGKFEPPTWIHILPNLVIVTGVLMVAVGAGLSNQESGDGQTLGLGLMVGGVAVGVGGGLLLYDASRGSHQEGASTRWWQPEHTAK